ncbi:MAG: hypothetical protein ACJ73N_02585 [Bryobacteraceae bacterium]
MHPVIAKTFGGLSLAYYVRHFIFGLLFPVFIYVMLSPANGKHAISLPMLLMFVVNTLLYPYSRFVYESVRDFILGSNVFLVNAVLMLGFKVVTMMFCWGLAIFIAPLGLGYLYFHHSRAER